MWWIIFWQKKKVEWMLTWSKLFFGSEWMLMILVQCFMINSFRAVSLLLIPRLAVETPATFCFCLFVGILFLLLNFVWIFCKPKTIANKVSVLHFEIIVTLPQHDYSPKYPATPIACNATQLILPCLEPVHSQNRGQDLCLAYLKKNKQ